ncbi:MAG: hypothetical protein N2255_09565, partial [Kiritimatiellae bacterium]|nr:hypothetical protein [Kiritimatiellia bacterium]
MNGITNKPRIISSPEKYSPSVCRHLRGFIERLPLLLRPRPDRYEEGDVLDGSLRTVWPEVEGTARLRIRKFVGGGFAGQVYRCLLERLELPIGSEEDFGLRPGTDYAVKIFIPPSRLARLFRDALYRLGFQAPFSAQVNESACRAGLLFQKLARRTARVLLDDENAVADVYASFFDATLGSFGEIREWVEGRFWRLEADVHPWRRRRWRTTSATDTDSPEYVAKRRFMYRVVAMLHEMGARELARQFEWWSMKSQPNILKRAGYDDSPDAGLCAFDFRPGLVLLPFLPMSPVDVRLIWEGLCRGVLVQLDRCEPKKLRALVERHPQVFCGADDLLSAWERYHEAARRAVPDLSRQGLRLLFDFRLRRDVRFGLVEGYVRTGLIDECFAARLRKSSRAFWSFYLLGAVPLFGHWFRRLWGSEIYRRHVRLLLGDRLYLARTWAAALAARLLRWHRSGRIGRGHTRRLLRRPWLFWIERLTLGCLPAVVPRVLSEPGYVVQRIGAASLFMRTFHRDAAFRQQWLAAVVE